MERTILLQDLKIIMLNYLNNCIGHLNWMLKISKLFAATLSSMCVLHNYFYSPT